jgi:hypothetical protein
MAYSYELSEKEMEVLHKLHECKPNYQADEKLIEQWQGNALYIVAVKDLEARDFVWAVWGSGHYLCGIGLKLRGEAWVIEHPENTMA